MLCFKGMPEQLENPLLEEVNLELAVREAESTNTSKEEVNRLKLMVARLVTAVKRNYGEIPPEARKEVYLRFLKNTLNDYLLDSAAPDCLVCENFPESANDCILHPGRYDEISEQGIFLCEDYSPISKEAEQKSKREAEQEIETVRQFIAELEQKHLKIIKHIHI